MTERSMKNWGKADKAALLLLIQDGSISAKDNRTEYIDWVGSEFFRHHQLRNFRRNFRNFIALYNAEAEHNGARRREEGKLSRLLLVVVSSLYLTCSLSPPPLIDDR
jgi:hypothetical protein